jgi:Flp pilus assembly protein TadB
MTIRERVRRWLNTGLLILAMLAAAVVAEYITPLRDLDAYLQVHPGVARGSWIVIIGLALLGTLLLVGTPFLVRVGDERRLSKQEAEALYIDSQGEENDSEGWHKSIDRFWGQSVGSGFSDEASFSEVKGAWRQRAWRTSPRWQRMFLMMAGGSCLLLATFVLLILIGSPLIRLISIIAVLYATLRISWAFWRSRREEQPTIGPVG